MSSMDSHDGSEVKTSKNASFPCLLQITLRVGLRTFAVDWENTAIDPKKITHGKSDQSTLVAFKTELLSLGFHMF